MLRLWLSVLFASGVARGQKCDFLGSGVTDLKKNTDSIRLVSLFSMKDDEFDPTYSNIGIYAQEGATEKIALKPIFKTEVSKSTRNRYRLFVGPDGNTVYAVTLFEGAALASIEVSVLDVAYKKGIKVRDTKVSALKVEIPAFPTDLNHFVLVGTRLINIKPCVSWDFMAEATAFSSEERCQASVETPVPGIDASSCENQFCVVHHAAGVQTTHSSPDAMDRVLSIQSCIYSSETGSGASSVAKLTVNGQSRCYQQRNEFEVQVFTSLDLDGQKKLCAEGWAYFQVPVVHKRENSTANANVKGGRCETPKPKVWDTRFGMLTMAAITALVTVGAALVLGMGMVGRARYRQHKQLKIDKYGTRAYTRTGTTLGATTAGLSTTDLTGGTSRTSGATTGRTSGTTAGRTSGTTAGRTSGTTAADTGDASGMSAVGSTAGPTSTTAAGTTRTKGTTKTKKTRG